MAFGRWCLAGGRLEPAVVVLRRFFAHLPGSVDEGTVLRQSEAGPIRFDDLQEEVMDEVEFELVHDKVMEDSEWPELKEE